MNCQSLVYSRLSIHYEFIWAHRLSSKKRAQGASRWGNLFNVWPGNPRSTNIPCARCSPAWTSPVFLVCSASPRRWSQVSFLFSSLYFLRLFFSSVILSFPFFFHYLFLLSTESFSISFLKKTFYFLWWVNDSLRSFPYFFDPLFSLLFFLENFISSLAFLSRHLLCYSFCFFFYFLMLPN